MALEMCINDKCMGQDTIIVLLYAVFCVVFGFITALLVMLADRMKGDREESEQASAESGTNQAVEKTVSKIEDLHRAKTTLTINRNISTSGQ